jgi:uncharacterized protein (DUF1697 family)
MTRHVGLLRAVNLGAHNKIAMRDLANLAAGLGLTDVRTVLASGNIVFTASGASGRLEEQLEKTAAKAHGLETDFFVRTSREWRAIVDANPFPKEAKADPARLVMLCLKDAPARSAVTALQAAIVGREVVRANGREAYIVYPDGQGQSKLTIKVIEKALGTRGTARNWNTVLKLLALVSDR